VLGEQGGGGGVSVRGVGDEREMICGDSHARRACGARLIKQIGQLGAKETIRVDLAARTDLELGGGDGAGYGTEGPVVEIRDRGVQVQQFAQCERHAPTLSVSIGPTRWLGIASGAVEITNAFVVRAPIDVVWATLTDLPL
jgi:hypothetical protein